jgi:hypothetical protein
MTVQHMHINGLLALGPGRAAVATLEQALAEPDLANDVVAIVGDSSREREKRDTYHAIFSVLGWAQRPVLWIPGPVDGAFEREVRSAYGTVAARLASRSPRNLLFTPGAQPANVDPTSAEIVSALVRTFEPRLAPRCERPAAYLVRERGRPEWLEI